jgi:CubicO group peptidase (beta-lactamase class C family)
MLIFCNKLKFNILIIYKFKTASQMKKSLSLFLFLIFSNINILSQTNEVEQVLNKYVRNSEIGGIVGIVAKKDKTISIYTSGFRDIDGNKKMTSDALFWIASQSKPITAVAAMILVEEGKIDLDKPITDYLPELKNMMVTRIEKENVKVLEKTDSTITIRKLLSHTSGMSFLNPAQELVQKIDIMSLETNLYVAATTPLLADPGTKYIYSNQGYNIVALAIERVSNLSFDEFVKIKIFDPLGMSSATFFPDEKQLEKIVTPYKMGESGQLESTKLHFLQYPLNDNCNRFVEAGGGIFCTPVDLIKFYQMITCGGILNGKRLLKPESISEFLKKQTPDNIENAYSLGWNIDGSIIGHGGAYGTNSRIYLKDGYIIMYFVQQQDLPKANEIQRSFFDTVEKVYNIE